MLTFFTGMDLTYSPNKELCSVIILVTYSCITPIILSFQILLVILITHTTAMYYMLAEEMLLLEMDDVEGIQVKEKLLLIINRHSMILDTINNFKSLYSIAIGANFGCNAICISLCFNLSQDEIFNFLSLVIYCCTLFFLYCFLCQKLVNSAEFFEQSVYSCGWEKFNVAEQKTVYVILLMSQREVEILATDIMPVNMHTFATTCQFMYKLVTVIKF